MKICMEFQNVSYAYPLTKKAAVRHLDLTLERGKCYGVIGPNAGGKTACQNADLQGGSGNVNEREGGNVWQLK